jgi:hypothetical protein
MMSTSESRTGACLIARVRTADRQWRDVKGGGNVRGAEGGGGACGRRWSEHEGGGGRGAVRKGG